jgi:SNF2 family DNA or RNA helicase
MVPLKPDQEFLFTRQKHEAVRAGTHYDIRLVIGDKAYSFATRKELPEPGKMTVLFEQPVHDASYALSKRIEIPEGQYGHGTTVLDFVRKAKVLPSSTAESVKFTTKSGETYLLRKMPDTKYGDKAWMFRNMSGSENKYLEKIAKKQEQAKLDPHQESALAQLEKEKGIVIHHSLGSKKTSTFLNAVARVHAKDPDAKALIIAPASLVSNVDNEIKKHNIKLNRSNLEVLSYQKALNDVSRLRKNKYTIAIGDEGQSFRNEKSKRTQELRDIISHAKYRALATATGNYNNIADMSTLVNIVANDDILPENAKDMEKEYVEEYKVNPPIGQRLMGVQPETHKTLRDDKKAKLKKVLNKYVNYYDSAEDPAAKEHFAKKVEKVVETEMSPEQERYYKYAEGKLPFLIRLKIRHNLPLDKKEKAQANSFSSGIRQTSNGYRHLTGDANAEYTPKILKAVENLKKGLKDDPNFKGLVYSNYLDAGLREYSRKLKEEGIKHDIYDGSLNREQKDKLLEKYNKGKQSVMLISSSGGEGLSTIGTKKVQILDPHWNPSKIQQVIGRAIRYDSHAHLPEDQRKVDVEYYHSVHKKPMWGKRPTTIDSYLHEHSERKDDLFDEVKQLMKNKK